jgi:acetylornithine deacetylase
MSELDKSSSEYKLSYELMSTMVSNSQRPGEGNSDFVASVGDYLVGLGLEVRTYPDPEYLDRKLLVVEVGDPEGTQKLAATSHADVVGIDGQKWLYNPWELTEEGDTWYARGVCDTHGSGVAMILAALQPETRKTLEQDGNKVSIIFTYDEEAQTSALSYRGALLATGQLGEEPIITSDYYLTGEPTEFSDGMIAMRGHKGRWLSNLTVDVEHAGHSAENVQNALAEACEIAHTLGQYAIAIKSPGKDLAERTLFDPNHSTIQITAADVKKGDASTTPNTARLTMDLRTLPDEHELRVQEVRELLEGIELDAGITLDVEVIDEYRGTLTDDVSPVTALAEEVTGKVCRGFNGGDEGQIYRSIGKEGITLGPGELRYAHMPNEQISIKSIMDAADIYSRLFRKASDLK